MKRTMLKSKIHRATVTNANLNYEGSISIDEALMLSANIIQYEKVEIYNINNGERFSTYVIKGKKNTGNICVNGAAARKVSIGDLIIICTYTDLTDFDQIMNKEYEPLVVKVNENNKEI